MNYPLVELLTVIVLILTFMLLIFSFVKIYHMSLEEFEYKKYELAISTIVILLILALIQTGFTFFLLSNL